MHWMCHLHLPATPYRMVCCAEHEMPALTTCDGSGQGQTPHTFWQAKVPSGLGGF